MQAMETGRSGTAVQVTFMGEITTVIGKRSLEVGLPEEATVGDLMASLSQTYGEAFTSRAFVGPGRLHHTMLVFVDGEEIKERGGLSAKLGGGKVDVILLPMFGGG